MAEVMMLFALAVQIVYVVHVMTKHEKSDTRQRQLVGITFSETLSS